MHFVLVILQSIYILYSSNYSYSIETAKTEELAR